MNLVRLGMIVALAAVAWYALSIYAALPSNDSIVMQNTTRTVEISCPIVNRDTTTGTGAILVALVAIGGALSVSAVDLSRRVY